MRHPALDVLGKEALLRREKVRALLMGQRHIAYGRPQRRRRPATGRPSNIANLSDGRRSEAALLIGRSSAQRLPPFHTSRRSWWWLSRPAAFRTRMRLAWACG